jgi:hypothetical protein
MKKSYEEINMSRRNRMKYGDTGASEVKNSEAIKNAIIIDAPDTALGIIEEHRYIEKIYGEKGKNWTLLEQRLIQENLKDYDMFLIKTADGFEIKIYFEITSFFGKNF